MRIWSGSPALRLWAMAAILLSLTALFCAQSALLLLQAPGPPPGEAGLEPGGAGAVDGAAVAAGGDFAAGAAAAAARSMLAISATSRLRLCFFSDLHAGLEETPNHLVPSDYRPSRAAALALAIRDAECGVVIFGGDALRGAPDTYERVLKQKGVARLVGRVLRLMGVHVAILGNHDLQHQWWYTRAYFEGLVTPMAKGEQLWPLPPGVELYPLLRRSKALPRGYAYDAVDSAPAAPGSGSRRGSTDWISDSGGSVESFGLPAWMQNRRSWAGASRQPQHHDPRDPRPPADGGSAPDLAALIGSSLGDLPRDGGPGLDEIAFLQTDVEEAAGTRGLAARSAAKSPGAALQPPATAAEGPAAKGPAAAGLDLFAADDDDSGGGDEAASASGAGPGSFLQKGGFWGPVRRSNSARVATVNSNAEAVGAGGSPLAGSPTIGSSIGGVDPPPRSGAADSPVGSPPRGTPGDGSDVAAASVLTGGASPRVSVEGEDASGGGGAGRRVAKIFKTFSFSGARDSFKRKSVEKRRPPSPDEPGAEETEVATQVDSGPAAAAASPPKVLMPRTRARKGFAAFVGRATPRLGRRKEAAADPPRRSAVPVVPAVRPRAAMTPPAPKREFSRPSSREIMPPPPPSRRSGRSDISGSSASSVASSVGPPATPAGPQKSGFPLWVQSDLQTNDRFLESLRREVAVLRVAGSHRICLVAGLTDTVMNYLPPPGLRLRAHPTGAEIAHALQAGMARTNAKNECDSLVLLSHMGSVDDIAYIRHMGERAEGKLAKTKSLTSLHAAGAGTAAGSSFQRVSTSRTLARRAGGVSARLGAAAGRPALPSNSPPFLLLGAHTHGTFAVEPPPREGPVARFAGSGSAPRAAPTNPASLPEMLTGAPPLPYFLHAGAYGQTLAVVDLDVSANGGGGVGGGATASPFDAPVVAAIRFHNVTTVLRRLTNTFSSYLRDNAFVPSPADFERTRGFIRSKIDELGRGLEMRAEEGVCVPATKFPDTKKIADSLRTLDYAEYTGDTCPVDGALPHTKTPDGTLPLSAAANQPSGFPVGQQEGLQGGGSSATPLARLVFALNFDELSGINEARTIVLSTPDVVPNAHAIVAKFPKYMREVETRSCRYTECEIGNIAADAINAFGARETPGVMARFRNNFGLWDAFYAVAMGGEIPDDGAPLHAFFSAGVVLASSVRQPLKVTGVTGNAGDDGTVFAGTKMVGAQEAASATARMVGLSAAQGGDPSNVSPSASAGGVDMGKFGVVTKIQLLQIFNRGEKLARLPLESEVTTLQVFSGAFARLLRLFCRRNGSSSALTHLSGVSFRRDVRQDLDIKSCNIYEKNAVLEFSIPILNVPVEELVTLFMTEAELEEYRHIVADAVVDTALTISAECQLDIHTAITGRVIEDYTCKVLPQVAMKTRRLVYDLVGLKDARLAPIVEKLWQDDATATELIVPMDTSRLALSAVIFASEYVLKGGDSLFSKKYQRRVSKLLPSRPLSGGLAGIAEVDAFKFAGPPAFKMTGRRRRASGGYSGDDEFDETDGERDDENDEGYEIREVVGDYAQQRYLENAAIVDAVQPSFAADMLGFPPKENRLVLGPKK